MARPKRNGVQRKFSVRNDLDLKLQEMAAYHNLEYVVLITKAFEAGFDILWQEYLDEVERSEKAEITNDYIQFSRESMEANPTISGLIVLKMLEEGLIIDVLPFFIDLPQETIVDIIRGKEPTPDELMEISGFVNASIEELHRIAARLQTGKLQPNGK